MPALLVQLPMLPIFDLLAPRSSIDRELANQIESTARLGEGQTIQRRDDVPNEWPTLISTVNTAAIVAVAQIDCGPGQAWKRAHYPAVGPLT